MGEKVDRRGFMRLLRRSDRTADDKAGEVEPAADVERELTAKEREIRDMAEFSARLLADVAPEDEERLADGPLLTKPYDLAYMRVTAGNIVYSSVIGTSALIKTSDVTAFDTEPAVDDDRGHGTLVLGVLRAHHPADLPTVTRSYALRFPAESPLVAAIRTACNIPEPEPEPVEEAEAEVAEGAVAERSDADDQ